MICAEVLNFLESDGLIHNAWTNSLYPWSCGPWALLKSKFLIFSSCWPAHHFWLSHSYRFFKIILAAFWIRTHIMTSFQWSRICRFLTHSCDWIDPVSSCQLTMYLTWCYSYFLALSWIVFLAWPFVGCNGLTCIILWFLPIIFIYLRNIKIPCWAREINWIWASDRC